MVSCEIRDLCKKCHIQLAKIFGGNLHSELDRFFFYAKCFFWSGNENTSLGGEQFALPKLQYSHALNLNLAFLGSVRGEIL